MASTIADLLRGSGLDPLDARVLMRAALQTTDAEIAGHPERVPGARGRARFLKWVARRRAGEPIAYLTGEREFYGLLFKVTPAVLIPRPDTELLVDLALERVAADASSRVLDLGTGSGCAAIAIARSRPRARVTALDIAPPALALARENAAVHGVELELVESDWFAALAGRRYDLVLANPPYIAESDPHLGRGDLRFEPRAALVSGPSGLDAIRTIVEQGARHLAPGGWLLFEHGRDQGDGSRGLLDAYDYGDVTTWRDLSGAERVSGGRV